MINDIQLKSFKKFVFENCNDYTHFYIDTYVGKVKIYFSINE